MKIDSFDHVALWVSDRERLADFLCTHVGMHVIEQTDAFTLVGADARRGKITLFQADGERDPGPLARVVLRVNDLEEAVRSLPEGSEHADGMAVLTAPEGLELALVEADGADYDLDHVILRVPDPESSLRELATLGLVDEGDGLRAGQAHLRLERGDPGEPERPLLNHLAFLVDSAQDHIDEAKERGLEIDDIKDAENTYAVFIVGPDRVRLEYVEHKPEFALK
jgi:catechol 2,3-dioxygenase-like lactoylglutathione lyase family enzyme